MPWKGSFKACFLLLVFYSFHWESFIIFLIFSSRVRFPSSSIHLWVDSFCCPPTRSPSSFICQLDSPLVIHVCICIYICVHSVNLRRNIFSSFFSRVKRVVVSFLVILIFCYNFPQSVSLVWCNRKPVQYYCIPVSDSSYLDRSQRNNKKSCIYIQKRYWNECLLWFLV